MIAEAFIIKDGKVLMVQQWVERGDKVWNFPGGGVEEGEKHEEACVREVLEETGYNVMIRDILFKQPHKTTFLAEVVGGILSLDRDSEYNSDILDVQWVDVSDNFKWDHITKPVLEIYFQNKK